MLKRMMITVGAGLLLGSLSLAQSEAFGSWSGQIGPGVLDLGVNVVLEGTEQEPSGNLDIPVQGLVGFELSDVTVDGNDVSFAMGGVPGNPVFVGTVAGDSMTGTFSQSGADFVFELERTDGERAGLVRPQEPQGPFPYAQEEVTVQSPAGEVTLTGTLTLPEGEGPFSALLFVSGSGPQDRDSYIFGHRPFLVLSDALARAGYASLRLDDRGMGGSEGLDHEASYEDLTADGVAGVQFLREHPAVSAVGVLGHSQGGYLAPVIAAETEVDFIISLAGPAVSGIEVLDLQNRLLAELSMPEATPEQLDAALEGQLGLIYQLHEFFLEGDVETAQQYIRDLLTPDLQAAGMSEDEIEEIIELQLLASATPSMASFMTFDPQPYLRQLDTPILAVYGGLDFQVPAEQSVAPLEEALEVAGNPDVEIHLIEDMNHVLQPAETGGPAEYTLIETTVHPELLELLVDWLAERY